MKLYQINTRNGIKYFGDIRKVRKYQNKDKTAFGLIINFTEESKGTMDIADFSTCGIEPFGTATFSDYIHWNGTFTNGQRCIAESFERKALNKMSETEKDAYFELTFKFANIEYTKADLLNLLNLLSKHNVSLITAMICY